MTLHIARKKVMGGIDKIENVQHQLVAVHDVLVNKRPEMGHALGMVEDPERSRRVAQRPSIG